MKNLTTILLILLTPLAYGQDKSHGLTITPENRCSDYSSRLYTYPQSIEVSIIDKQGGIFSPYNMECFGDRSETDIEHIVARSEAHDSGLCAASGEVRKQFSRDLVNLTLASPNLNRSIKRAKDVAEWIPSSNQCWYVNAVIEVKRKYHLTVDQEESDVLNQWLNQCESFEMVKPTCPVVQRTTRSRSTTSPRRSNSSKCGPYANCTALRRDHPNGVGRGHCAYQPRMDRDKDGWACER